MTRHHSNAIENGWTGRLGDSTRLRYVDLLGRRPRVQVEMVEAVAALDAALSATGYENPCDYIGSYSYRTIAGLDVWSEHAYGIALDIDYGGDNPASPDHPGIDKNPHLHRRIEPGDPAFGRDMQFTERDIEAIEAIENIHGEQVWSWLGWSIGDTMHVAIALPPEALQVDWTTVEGYERPNYRGVINVPNAEWARKVIDSEIDAGTIVTGDDYLDDWEDDRFTMGRLWTIFARNRGNA